MQAFLTVAVPAKAQPMPARVRKLIGGIAIVAFVIAYAALAVTISGWLPKTPLVELPYYLVVGIAWGVPIIPLITWMNRGR
jgi:hypothetical protein